MENKFIMMHILDVRTASPFKDLFAVKPAVLAGIIESMKKIGYDKAFPIVIWGGHGGVVVDGHTRLQAAKDAGLLEVAVVARDFDDELTALEYAIDCQRNRRNITDDELLACVNALDERKKIGRPGKTAPHGAISGRSSEATARLLGISRTKVERIRTVNDHGTAEMKKAIASGKMSINKAYNELMRQRKEKESEAANAGKSVTEVRAERMTALIASASAMIRNCLEQESQLFPELRYTEDERKQLCGELSDAVAKLVTELIPCEN